MPKVPLTTRIRNKSRDIRHNLSARIRGTEHYEKEWSARKYDRFYWESVNHPHRDLLLSKVSAYSPSSVLEIGCNSGPNLLRIARAFPSAKLRGIDINRQSIDVGKKMFEESGIKNVDLDVGRADELGVFGDKSFDVVLTDAVLIYIGKDKIDTVASEMLRIAKKAIVMVEYQDSKAEGRGSFIMKKGYWARDYAALFKPMKDVAEVRMTKITREIWDDDYWSSLGHVVEVRLKDA
jgi:ubiquinone/menaquinone biosynthesis C-methylase UbiE